MHPRIQQRPMCVHGPSYSLILLFGLCELRIYWCSSWSAYNLLSACMACQRFPANIFKSVCHPFSCIHPILIIILHIGGLNIYQNVPHRICWRRMFTLFMLYLSEGLSSFTDFPLPFLTFLSHTGRPQIVSLPSWGLFILSTDGFLDSIYMDEPDIRHGGCPGYLESR